VSDEKNWKKIVHYEPLNKTIDFDLSATNAIQTIDSRKAARIDQ